ncbi:hypothetical protein H112_07458 [Trichophyton rubrum D6]|uniref:Uncharacterized protein n=4 Tax=Trichophyton TaxID=5550 RepID=A0A178EWM2_TRIRU|nr:uncharacterized protein TERG_00064 [Trichophyton rubrum CBS 118892]EZF11442.1 hypothetical protein H100_07483 [Trichophyton rubrum MR850]EZF38287.1 hypothetical protein H102_07447 [Trichophyton rubrum CBS 100081]EZF48904.1 hypothetical protein H103_07471 [Trichophyton rubrum CBS 288.86]EZF59553.1 hypothetical protein H104_07419 [Trichophyton rubrum CBS 289.86]EZF70189.1 hypothetical protein H105_07477 [Trichophyton soudanense CBS 452.61]EZF80787.1 hypothetical protein H110_07466 [Trichophy
MFPTNGQDLATPERTSSSGTNPFRPQPPKINTNVPHIMVNGKPVEVIEISSSPSPQDTNPEPAQKIPAPGPPQGQPVQQPMHTQHGSPFPFTAAPAGSSQRPHTIFKPIKIHTAKCDVCNKHNKSTLQRCIDCGWQICTPCWNARGGNGAHGSVRKFTGTIYRSSDDELPQKKPRKKGKNSNNGAKDTPPDKGKAVAKDIASTPMRPNPDIEENWTPSVVPIYSTESANSSPSMFLTDASDPRAIIQRGLASLKMQFSSGPASVKPAGSSSDLPSRASVGCSKAPRTPESTHQAITDNLSSSSSLTSLSALEEDCGYRGDEENENEDDDATDIDPENEDVLIADGRAYQKRVFKGLNPMAQTRMNWLLIAAEQALKEREKDQKQSKERNEGPKTPVPATRKFDPPTRSWILTPSQHSSPAPKPDPAPEPSTVAVASQPPPSTPVPTQTRTIGATTVVRPVPISLYFRSPSPVPEHMRGIVQAPKRRILVQPLDLIEYVAPPAVPVSELIPRPDPMDIDQPRPVSNPSATRHPRMPLHQREVPFGLRDILPGDRETEKTETSERERREAEKRTLKPHGRAWEL